MKPNQTPEPMPLTRHGSSLTIGGRKMKSFRIYLPGGREPSAAGLLVVSIGILAMGTCLYFMDEIAARLPQLTIVQTQALMILCALSVIGIGWLVLKLFGVSFVKKEPIQQPQQQRP